jgi:serine protease Do
MPGPSSFGEGDPFEEFFRRFQLDPDQKGIVVTDVEVDSPAALAGIQPGDIMQEVNRQPVESVNDFAKATAGAIEQDTLLVLVRRDDASTFFALRKGE